MATIKTIDITRNGGERPAEDNNYFQGKWYVKVGEKFDSVKFIINELDKFYYWITTLYVPSGMEYNDIKELAETYAKTITEEDIKEYREFLEDGEKWGWD